MNADEITAYCLQKKGAYIDFPFGAIPACVKVCSRIFAQVYPKADDYKLTLKCDPVLGGLYRQAYPGTVLRGYHCPPVQQPFWNTVYLNGGISDAEIKMMIDHAYGVVVSKLPKRLQKELSDSQK